MASHMPAAPEKTGLLRLALEPHLSSLRSKLIALEGSGCDADLLQELNATITGIERELAALIS